MVTDAQIEKIDDLLNTLEYAAQDLESDVSEMLDVAGEMVETLKGAGVDDDIIEQFETLFNKVSKLETLQVEIADDAQFFWGNWTGWMYKDE